MQFIAILQIIGIVLVIRLIGMISHINTSFIQLKNRTQSITPELNAKDDVSFGGSTHYYINEVESNATGLEEIEGSDDSLSSYLIPFGDKVSPCFTLKVPMADNPNSSSVKQIDSSLKIETF